MQFNFNFSNLPKHHSHYSKEKKIFEDMFKGECKSALIHSFDGLRRSMGSFHYEDGDNLDIVEDKIAKGMKKTVMAKEHEIL